MTLIDAKPRSTGKRRTGHRINRKLIELRLNRGWTPNDLARNACISGNTVRAAERGLYIDPRSQFAIAHALGCELLDVFPFDRQKEAR